MPDAPAQEVVHLATDADFDILTFTCTYKSPEDAGRITMGVVGSDPKTMSDVTRSIIWF